MFQFVKTTAAGGLLFILPLILLAVLIEKAVHLLRPVVEKVVPLLHGIGAAGITAVTLTALVVLLLSCFVAGLFARTALATRGMQALEDKLLSNLPGYQLAKDAAGRFAGMDNVDGAAVAMLIQDAGFRFGLVLETRGDWLLIYLADGGPAGGTAGEVQLLPKSQVILTDISWLSLLACLRRGGRGALELAAVYLPQHPDQNRVP